MGERRFPLAYRWHALSLRRACGTCPTPFADSGMPPGVTTHLQDAAMQLPDEAIAYQYQSLLVPRGEEWTPAAELRAQHFLSPAQLRKLTPRLMQVRSQVAAERELQQVPPEMQPLDAGFIDLPQKTARPAPPQGEASAWAASSARRPPARPGRPRRHPGHRRLAPGRPCALRGPARTATTTSCPPRTARARRASISRATTSTTTPAGPARPAAEHLRRSGAARGALGRRGHQQVGRHPGNRRRLPAIRRELAEYYGAIRPSGSRTSSSRSPARPASCATCAWPTATPTTTS